MPRAEPFFEHVISVGDLRKSLTKSELAALAVASFSDSEVYALLKLVSFSTRDLTGDYVLDANSFIQQTVLLRGLTLRLFEFLKFIQTCTRQNGIVGEAARQTLEEFDDLKSCKAYELVQCIRDRVAAHCSFDDAKKSLKHVSDSADATTLLSSNRWNSAYLLGEEAIFFAQVNAVASGSLSKSELLSEWHEWCFKAANCLTFFHMRLRNSLLKDLETAENVARKVVVLDDADVAKVGETKLPLFVSEEPQ